MNVNELITAKETASKSIKRAGDLKTKMLETFRTGSSRGTTTYFPSLDPHWTWKKSELTCFTGYPNHGKTEFALQLMLIKAVKEGTKFALFSPENHPEHEIFNQLIHTFIGDSTERHHPNQMSEQEYVKAIDFVHEMFPLVSPPDESNNLTSVLGLVEHTVNALGVEGFLIDPWNALDHDERIRDDKQVRAGLTEIIRFEKRLNLYGVIVTHPRSKPPKDDGTLSAPTQFDIAQGAMWNNRCDNIISIHRPNYFTDKSDTSVEVNVLKIKKQKQVGIPGDLYLNYNRMKARYYDSGLNPLNSQKIESTELSF